MFPEIDLPRLLDAGLLMSRTFEKRQIIFHENEPKRGPFVLARGFVKLYLNHEDGSHQIVRIVGQGELFGLAHVVADTANAYTAETLAPSETLMFEPETFLELVHTNRELCRQVGRFLAVELGRAREIHRELSKKTARMRLAAILVRLCKDFGTESARGMRIDLPLTRGDLAQLCSVAPETLTRLLSEFNGENLVYLSGKSILVPDLHRLAAVARLSRL